MIRHALAFTLLFSSLCAAMAASSDPQRPNILFVVGDDHSAPYVGCYGYPVKTPNLDRFAAAGLRFDRAFVSAPQCAPSRTAIAAGRSPVAIGTSRFSSPLPPEIVTFPEILRAQAGYYTGICRRAHHLDGWVDSRSKVSPEIWQRHQMASVPRRFDYVNMTGDRNATVPIFKEFLDRVPSGHPFFLWVSLNDPHHPWDAAKVHDPDKLPLPPGWPNLPGLLSDLARYLDEVTRLDEEFQWVLDVLEQRGLAQNTLVVYIGDNGIALPHGKGALYDPGINVPLLVRWPGVIRPGGASPALISGEDFAPTFLAAAGLAAPKEVTGQSFLPLLRGEPGPTRKFVFAIRGVHGNAILNDQTVSNGYDLGRCVRSATHKLILNYTPWMRYSPTDSSRDAGWPEMVAANQAGTLAPAFRQAYFANPRPFVELYDLASDPGELNNLAGRPEVAALERELKLALQEKMITDYDYLPMPLRE